MALQCSPQIPETPATASSVPTQLRLGVPAPSPPLPVDVLSLHPAAGPLWCFLMEMGKPWENMGESLGKTMEHAFTVECR